MRGTGKSISISSTPAGARSRRNGGCGAVRGRRELRPGRQAAGRIEAQKPRLALSIQYAIESGSLPRRRELRRWTIAALQRDAEITLRFVGKAEGRALNRYYRGRDYPTNVLTFVYDDAPGGLAGDIVLCAPTISREAREQRKTPGAHYAHILVHGVLHLQGYDHQDDAEAESMEALETQILTRLGYDNPYRR
jgi:probable rRNA maturation factor